MFHKQNIADINECLSNPCRRGQKCLNMNGKYECIPSVQCKIGYELDSEGTRCVGKRYVNTFYFTIVIVMLMFSHILSLNV